MTPYHIASGMPFYTNTYLLIGQNRRAAVIDPSAQAQEYLDILEKEHAQLTHILLTHGHYDHVHSAQQLREETGAKIWMNGADARGNRLFPFTSPDFSYTDGEDIHVDSDLIFRVIETPGHSEGSVCLWTGNLLLSGDTLFQGSMGRTDFEGGSAEKIRESLKKLCRLVPDEVHVLPGHQGFSTMKEEKRCNPYLQFEE